MGTERKQALREMIAEFITDYRTQQLIAVNMLDLARNGCDCEPGCKCPDADTARQDATTAATLAHAASTAAHTIALLLAHDNA